MFNIIVTGFEPFGGSSTNASWEAVKALPDTIGAYTVHKILLPVEFNRAAEKLIALGRDIDPCWILLVGENGRASDIAIERFAHNLQYAEIPDNAGQKPQNRQCIGDGDLALESRHPIFDQLGAIRSEGIPAHISTTAGTYVCNDLFYQVMTHYLIVPTRVGFIHVPRLKKDADDAGPFMAVEDITRALLAAIEVL